VVTDLGALEPAIRAAFVVQPDYASRQEAFARGALGNITGAPERAAGHFLSVFAR
jgi:hypothetical protein